MKYLVPIFFLACGGDHHEAEHAEHGAGGSAEHHKGMSPALQGFHDVLAPVWHAEPGATRVAKACEASTPMVDKVAPTNDPELISAVSALAKACMSGDKAQVEPQLTKVHERFHALMEK